ncbi:hypothetical protein EM595_p1129 (plasmid) [Duffyella gerundensis]|uniref:Uncharacterized protein n=1 Tax=Duffyella gerundensis TaxID=1619313 RepID=A0A0U5LCZ1_9GAMM|nr:hypothetical protein EM595_p1129 [Duffyella gerundensis]
MVVRCGKDAESGWTGQPLTHYPKMKINCGGLMWDEMGEIC